MKRRWSQVEDSRLGVYFFVFVLLEAVRFFGVVKGGVIFIRCGLMRFSAFLALVSSFRYQFLAR